MTRSTRLVAAALFLLAVAAVLTRVGAAAPPAQAVSGSPPAPARALTAADVARLRQGGTVRLAPGRYAITAPVEVRGARGFTLAGDGVTLVGRGRGVLRFTDCSDFRLEGLTFAGGRADAGGDPRYPTVRLDGCSDFTIEGCRFERAAGDHLYLAATTPGDPATATRDGRVIDCRFVDAWRNAISVIHAHHVRFEANAVELVHGDVLGAGIDIEGNAEDASGCNHDLTIARNRFARCAETGVRITDGRQPYRVDVTDNTFQACPTGVLVNGRDCRVRGNAFRDVANPGGEIGERSRAQVYLGAAPAGLTEVTGNRFHKLTGVGAVNVSRDWRGGPVVIADNVIADIKGDAVAAVVAYAPGVTVRGNVIEDVEAGLGILLMPEATGGVVTGNVLRRGTRPGIQASAAGAVVNGNTLIAFGDVETTAGAAVDAVIEGNATRK